mgnify:CR=1 FL=1
MRGATSIAYKYVRRSKFQSTPPVRGATDGKRPKRSASTISIHAPRAGGDRKGLRGDTTEGDFNPRPPCGGRPDSSKYSRTVHDFNPRPPCGGRHMTLDCGTEKPSFQSTPPVRGATLSSALSSAFAQISIHAPRAGGDQRIYAGI